MRNLARVSGLFAGTGVGIAPHIILIFMAFGITDVGMAIVILCGGCLAPLVSLIMPGLFYSVVYTRFYPLSERRGALGGALSSVLAQLIAGVVWFIMVVFFQGFIMDSEFWREVVEPMLKDPEAGEFVLSFLGGVIVSLILLTFFMALLGALGSAFTGSLGAKLFSRNVAKGEALGSHAVTG